MIWLTLVACTGDSFDSASAGDSRGAETGAPADSGELTPVASCGTVEPLAWGQDTCVDAAPCRLSGEQAYEYLGYSLASGHDVDGDGLPEVLAGALGYDEGDTAYAGRAALVYGASWAAGEPAIGAALTARASQAYLGHSVALSPDVNGDGYAELLVGSYGAADPDAFAGAVHLVLGGPSLPATLSADASWTGESAYGQLGYRVLAPGDLDGDGLAELAFAGELKTLGDDGQEDYRAGSVYVVRGSETPAGGSAADADARWDGASDGAASGLGLAAADFDGDGDGDLAVSAPYGSSNYGDVYLIDGADAVAGGSLADQTDVGADAYYSGFGVFLAADDLDGDGAAELVIGAPSDDRALPDAGAVHIYAGGADALTGAPERVAVLTGAWDDAWLGSGLATGGDVDGDGLNDLLVGAITAWTGLRPKNGRSAIYKGRTAWTDATLDDAELRFHGVGRKDYLGQAQALADLDADGRADVVIGSGFHDVGSTDVGMLWVFFGG